MKRKLLLIFLIIVSVSGDSLPPSSRENYFHVPEYKNDLYYVLNLRWPPGVCYLTDCKNNDYKLFEDRFVIHDFQLMDRLKGELKKCAIPSHSLNEGIY